MKGIILIIFVCCALPVLGIFASWWLAFSIGLIILGSLGYLERTLNIKWSSRSSIFLLILFVLLSGAYTIINFNKSMNSDRQIADLSRSYRPIEETALERYPELPKEKAIKKYLNRIKDIEADNEQLKEENIKNKQRVSELKQKFADRLLTDAQLTAIVDKVKPFAAQEFLVTTYWDHKESLSITDRISAALLRADWRLLKHKGGSWLFGGTTGVQVVVHPAADTRTKKAAAALVSALTTEGITSELKYQDPGNPNNWIYLHVGTKP